MSHIHLERWAFIANDGQHTPRSAAMSRTPIAHQVVSLSLVSHRGARHAETSCLPTTDLVPQVNDRADGPQRYLTIVSLLAFWKLVVWHQARMRLRFVAA